MALSRSLLFRVPLEKSLNATFSALVLEKGKAIDIRYWHPISLVGCASKIMAKVLARKLKSAVQKVISPSPNECVGWGKILDAILIANKCIDSKLRSETP